MIINVLFLAVGLYFVESRGGFSYVSSKMNGSTKVKSTQEEDSIYQKRNSLFDLLPVGKDSIVFLGDSITTDNEWREVFDNPNIVNRGIPRDSTFGVLNRLDSIILGKPKILFLMVVTNDIYFSDMGDSTSNYRKIIDRLTTETPNTKIYVQSVIPVNNDLSSVNVEPNTIKNFKQEIKQLSEEFNLTYIDLFPFLSNDKDELYDKYTFDEVHLNGEAYMVWKDEIEKYME